MGSTFTILASWVALGFIALLGATIIGLIWLKKIDLSRLISEPNGDASMSRFQLLVFTFVIAVCLFLVTASATPRPAFPVIPQGVLLLLGISGSSYLVSKGIQFSSDAGVTDRPPAVLISPQAASTKVGGTAVTFTAAIRGMADQSVTWAIAPSVGTIRAGVYTPPATGSPDTVQITATSVSDPSLSDTATVTVTS